MIFNLCSVLIFINVCKYVHMLLRTLKYEYFYKRVMWKEIESMISYNRTNVCKKWEMNVQNICSFSDW